MCVRYGDTHEGFLRVQHKRRQVEWAGLCKGLKTERLVVVI